MTKKLAGKVALVTGASSGIGEATAVALAEEGARVAALARREDRLEQIVKRIKKTGGEAVSIMADMTNEVQLRSAILQAKETFGRIGILVNNAGVMLLYQIDCLCCHAARTRQHQRNAHSPHRTSLSTLEVGV